MDFAGYALIIWGALIEGFWRSVALIGIGAAVLAVDKALRIWALKGMQP